MRIRVRRPAILRRRTHALRLVVRWRRHGAVAPRRESGVQRLNVRLPLCDIWSEDFAVVGQETIDFAFNVWEQEFTLVIGNQCGHHLDKELTSSLGPYGA